MELTEEAEKIKDRQYELTEKIVDRLHKNYDKVIRAIAKRELQDWNRASDEDFLTRMKINRILDRF